MSDPGYVIAGWSLAAIVLGLYTFRLARKIRQAQHERRLAELASESEPESESLSESDSGPAPGSESAE